MNPRHRPGGFNIDGLDPGVGAGASNKRRVQCVRREQVIDIAPGARYKAQRFFSSNALSDGRSDWEFHSALALLRGKIFLQYNIAVVNDFQVYRHGKPNRAIGRATQAGLFDDRAALPLRRDRF